MAKDCELVCDGCEGAPQKVKVSGNGWDRPFFFEYCDKAIRNDRLSGFTVELLNSTPNPEPSVATGDPSRGEP